MPQLPTRAPLVILTRSPVFIGKGNDEVSLGAESNRAYDHPGRDYFFSEITNWLSRFVPLMMPCRALRSLGSTSHAFTMAFSS